MGGIFGSSLVHSDPIDEDAAPTEQKLPKIGERRRLTERLIPIRRNNGLLAVVVSIEFYYCVFEIKIGQNYDPIGL